MKSYLLALLVVSVNSYPKEHGDDRIVGGRKASIRSLSHQAQLLQNGVQICGAVIIGNHWILTAAHCIRRSGPKWTITTGSDIVSEGVVHEIRRIFVHPLYNVTTGENDIALLLLVHPIIFNQCQNAIPLPTRRPATGDVMTISGFGKRGQHMASASSLEATSVRIVDQQLCSYTYAHPNTSTTITDGMFCAGETGDSCQGDSGGPGIFNGELIGIVSFGSECGSITHPGVYTNVYMYVNWINQVMQKYAGVLAPVSAWVNPPAEPSARFIPPYSLPPTQNQLIYQHTPKTSSVSSFSFSRLVSAIGEKLSHVRNKFFLHRIAG
ncbi:hypothetical protein QAD02_012469 [Eretmocerus hayati]|uniref:Uncharacterized protein n=1 Tax=Eretmocerus hayati TaxID=131215 RepID=A0ACC2NZT9_9HYME|nr:hypothetical protein QAD02_012469 [Eretmocerus hayati]